MILTLPWACLVADNARHGLHRGRIMLTARYRSALTVAGTLACAQWKGPALCVPVRMTVAFYEPDKRRRDIGNYTKLIADALVGVAFDDDSQIDELVLVRRTLCRENPRAEIDVAPL